MTKRKLLLRDDNGSPMPLMPLSDSQDVDGSLASAQSVAIDGSVVRICAIDGDIRFEIGANPEATATSHWLGDHTTIEQPIDKGHKVAVIGGKANISTCGS